MIAYTAYSRPRPARRRWRRPATSAQLQRLGPVMPPEDKDAALFPRRFDGRWAMIHRPSPLRGGAHMWISFSPDLRHWADHRLLLEARDGAWWDAGKIGLGPPPLETADGWLILYHGAHTTAAGPIYRVGLALLDLDDPTVVLRRSDEWVFGPQAPYERSGDVPQVVFPWWPPGGSRRRPAGHVLRRRGHGRRPRVGVAQRGARLPAELPAPLRRRAPTPVLTPQRAERLPASGRATLAPTGRSADGVTTRGWPPMSRG